jgi:putative membrane protein
MMMKYIGVLAALALAMPGAASAADPNDAQIAHIAYTAGQIDVTAGELALKKTTNKEIRSFAQEMVRDHAAVNKQALALVTKLKVTPEDNATSKALSADAATKLKAYAALDGEAFDRAYIANEIAFHKTVNGALSSTLIPSAQNPELKALLETGLKVFTEHQAHAEHVAMEVK